MCDQMKRNAAKYLCTVVAQCILGALTFFLAAGSWNVPRGAFYFAIYFLASLSGGLYLYLTNAETLEARKEIAGNTKKWDAPILKLFVLLSYFGIYVAAGLSQRLGQPYPPVILYWVGIVMTVAATIILIWAVKENRNFESSVRIQNNRNHTVCSSGPYTFIRHPGYFSIVMWAVAMVMMFGCYTGIVSALITILLVVRTILEDAMLHSQLPGYAEYSKKVRYRLLPAVW
jgi:Isoprenylcysteine carboxyl methyltransferase (ICMT) family.